MKEKLSQVKLANLGNADVTALMKAEKSYGMSWKKRVGVGAFMMLARKWYRMENQVKIHGWDIFEAAKKDTRPEGILDDIRDLRRYLLLVDDFINNNLGGNNDA